MNGDQIVGGRIEDVGIDPVDDAAEFVPAGTEDPVQAFAVLGRLDLFGIGLADGGDLVGVDKAALQHIAVGKGQQLVDRKEIHGQAGNAAHDLRVEKSLELQIMHGHDGLDPLIKGIAGKFSLQIDRDETGVPVIAVDDIRPEAERRQYAQDGLAEKAEFFDVIVIISIRIAAAEIFFVVDEVINDAVPDEFLDTDVPVAPVEKRLEIADRLHFAAVLFGDNRVGRDHHADFELFAVDHGGKRADHVGQAACFDERDTF